MQRLLLIASLILVVLSIGFAAAQEKSDINLGSGITALSNGTQHFQEWGYRTDQYEMLTCIVYFAKGNTRFTKAPTFTNTWSGNRTGWSTSISPDRKAVYIFGPRTHFGKYLFGLYEISYIIYYDSREVSQETVVFDGNVLTYKWSRTGITGDGGPGQWTFNPLTAGESFSPISTNWTNMSLSGHVNSPGPGAYVGELMQVGPMSATGLLNQPTWPWGVIDSYTASPAMPQLSGGDIDHYGWGMNGTIDYLDLNSRTHVSSGSWWIYYTPILDFPIEQGTYLIKTVWKDGWSQPATVTGKFLAQDGSTVQPIWPVDYVDWSTLGVASFSGTFTNPDMLSGSFTASDNKLVLKDPSDQEILFVRFGQPINLELHQMHMAVPAAGYQAFLSFDPDMINFVEGQYTLSPYGLEICDITPIDETNPEEDYLNIAAGINPATQPHYAADAKLADIVFTSGTIEGITQVVFRNNSPISQFTDNQGYPIQTQTVDGPIVVIDNTPPAGLTLTADPASWTKDGPIVLTFSAIDALSGIDHYDLVINGSDYFSVASPYELNIETLGTGEYEATIIAYDKAGNSSTAKTEIHIDKTPPVLTVPPDQTVLALPDSNSAIVDPGMATAVDNVDLSPVVTGVRSDGLPLDAPYTGVTTITWTARDFCGNVSIGYQTITVQPYNRVTLTVQLESVFSSPSRMIDITFGGDGASGSRYKESVLVNFNAAGVGEVTIDTLPCGVRWTKVTAKDRQHTLRSAANLSVSPDGTKYEAAFTGTNMLIGGDLTDDNLIDIRDYGVFSGQYGSAGHPYPERDADISCDGQVWGEDFTYIQIHFTMIGAPQCGYAASAAPPANGTGVSSGVMTSISVKEMASLIGMKDARKADINNDGTIDSTDISLFYNRNIKKKQR